MDSLFLLTATDCLRHGIDIPSFGCWTHWTDWINNFWQLRAKVGKGWCVSVTLFIKWWPWIWFVLIIFVLLYFFLCCRQTAFKYERYLLVYVGHFFSCLIFLGILLMQHFLMCKFLSCGLIILFFWPCFLASTLDIFFFAFLPDVHLELVYPLLICSMLFDWCSHMFYLGACLIFYLLLWVV